MVLRVGINFLRIHNGEIAPMKKFMTLMLGLSLLSGIAAFAQDKPADTNSTTTTKKHVKKSKKKHASTTSTTSEAK